LTTQGKGILFLRPPKAVSLSTKRRCFMHTLREGGVKGGSSKVSFGVERSRTGSRSKNLPDATARKRGRQTALQESEEEKISNLSEKSWTRRPHQNKSVVRGGGGGHPKGRRGGKNHGRGTKRRCGRGTWGRGVRWVKKKGLFPSSVL